MKFYVLTIAIPKQRIFNLDFKLLQSTKVLSTNPQQEICDNINLADQWLFLKVHYDKVILIKK